MNLNHINLVVTDVAKAIKLFETHFEFKCTEIKGDNIVAILKNVNDFTLVIMKSKDEKAVYPQAFHIGFMLDSQEEVIAIYNSLKNESIIDSQEPRKIRDSFGFYFNFENIMIEIGHYLS